MPKLSYHNLSMTEEWGVVLEQLKKVKVDLMEQLLVSAKNGSPTESAFLAGQLYTVMNLPGEIKGLLGE